MCFQSIFILVTLYLKLVSTYIYTKQHQICYKYDDNPTNHESCHPAPYYDYILTNIQNSSGFRLSIYQEILAIYDNLEQSRQVSYVRLNDQLNITLYPISFSIPDHLILNLVPPKDKVFGRVIPDVIATYYKSAAEEADYYHDMSISYFAITFKKGGWDCLRNNEILASGCLPLFIDIDRCGSFPLAAHPKKLYNLIRQWPGLKYNWKYTSRWGDISISNLKLERNMDVDLYRVTVAALLHYTKNVLSSTSMAEYFLATIVKEFGLASYPNSILYLTHYDVDVAAGDYTTDTLLHGLHQIMNRSQITDFPSREVLYRTSQHFNRSFAFLPSKNRLYGHGYTLGLSIDRFDPLPAGVIVKNQIVEPHSLEIIQTVKDRITSKVFDIIVIASGHRYGKRQDLVKTICETYPRNRVVIVDGSDGELHTKQIEHFSSCAQLFFSREGPTPKLISK
jgi:hypothetical protein